MVGANNWKPPSKFGALELTVEMMRKNRFNGSTVRNGYNLVITKKQVTVTWNMTMVKFQLCAVCLLSSLKEKTSCWRHEKHRQAKA